MDHYMGCKLTLGNKITDGLVSIKRFADARVGSEKEVPMAVVELQWFMYITLDPTLFLDKSTSYLLTSRRTEHQMIHI